ncbi:DRTGG domain-containing protein [Sedimentibacter sp.]|uniref:DRTGG domain-containing protein n=1 Tax=Sedimentibacter sp. TaxID=1960295 RepID=UPI0028AE54B0|nr:DRTGG domain-containing protein [Sedimentibacter sp.]
MKILDFSNKLNLDPLYETSKDIEIDGVYIGDLLSIVMAKAKKNYVWITIQTHINTVAVAELLDLSCIIVVENMEVEEETLNKARELNIPVFKTKASAYETAVKLYEIGIK